ncbi:MAG TPA: response regulator [Vicinamibacteria bacterium]|nr:response regulator [Vicinamibacteria bacterium]
MGKKILLADDSITIQKVIELTFSDEDFEVVTVGNGRLAVEKVQEVRPDLVLCDIIMPEKDGYEVCDFIKRTPNLSHIPVLLLTGAFEPFDQERAGRVGCDGFLAKPFEPQTLIAKVKDLLSRAPAPRPAVGASIPPPAATQPPAFLAPPPVPEASSSTQIYERPLFDEPAFEPEPVPSFGAFEPAAPSPTPSFEPEFEAIEAEPVPAEPPPASPARFEAVQPAALVTEPTPEEQAIPGLPAMEAVPFEPEPFEPPPLPEPEPMGFPSPEPAPAEPEVYFIPEEPYAAEAPPAPSVEPEELLPMASAAAVDQYSVHTLDEAVAAVEEAAEPASDFYRAVEAPEPELVPVTAEEAASLSGVPATQAPAPPALEPPPAWEPSAPLVSWSQPTVEVPLEERARAAMLSAQESEAVFEEVFEEEVPAVRAAAVESTLRPLQEPASPPAPEPPIAEPPPAVAEVTAEESFEEVLPEPQAVATPSAAAEVAVPVDMVSQIAQRVVAQISEKVIREIAWEVIPDLAEALIKKEIERLKAELPEP